MSKLYKKKKTIGHPPGTILDTQNLNQKVIISVFDYDAKNVQEKNFEKIEDCFPFKDSPTVTWINIEGINSSIIKKIDEHYGIHPLVSEDIVSSGQRPKMEDYGDYIFIVLKMIYFNDKVHDIVDEQISLILGSNFVISFQEQEGDVFDPIRKRILEGKGRIRTVGTDYLAYTLLDAVVDNYYVVLEKKGDDIEKLEEEVMLNPSNSIGRKIHNLKRDMIYLRKQIWPLREVISALQRDESDLIKKQTGVYLRDVYDHTIQVMDTVDSFRDMISGIHDSYLSGISNKMNEIMKVLTIFAAIFIPLTFMAGVYGMNFEFMPELKWKYGYFVLLGLMASVGFGMLFYFKKRKWI
ncbi:MAG: magnesium/cobalt transporter CorA [Candidatus Omnitrophica bacterium]|nr:magnesium/cobalt transporter CorA [Candidatus Omnitrophota bacterium]MBU1995696.1 magnesium/cobalt transporter CorA [Candidatus Omnitrophota bacterium]MBU4333295.1 magnesium/cobalt transporter CorA [Candidatus Omnitrophota bacterium]